MTKANALAEILSHFRVGTKTVSYDYDPAGSSYELVPYPRDLAILEALIGRSVSEGELEFNIGTAISSDYYALRDRLI